MWICLSLLNVFFYACGHYQRLLACRVESRMHMLPVSHNHLSSSRQAFSVFFVCVAFTSDIICLLFIPVQWLFFAASTYVWVQYVWHTGKALLCIGRHLLIVVMFCERLPIIMWSKSSDLLFLLSPPPPPLASTGVLCNPKDELSHYHIYR